MTRHFVYFWINKSVLNFKKSTLMSASIEDLIEKLKKQPRKITFDDIELLCVAVENKELPFKRIREIALEILDLSNDGIFSSTAGEGATGFLNSQSRSNRKSIFINKLKNGFRESAKNTVVLAEGDSWFEHPVILDTLDHLMGKVDIALCSQAFGADWLDNMIYQGEYIDSLSLYKPDVFLVSGGGNDMLGDQKIALYIKSEVAKNENFVAELKKKVQDGKATYDELISDNFYAFVRLLQWQYYLMFRSIRCKYPDMPIITQGYDNALPQSLIKRPFYWVYWFQYPLNVFQKSGNWLETACRIGFVQDPEVMAGLIREMINVFNSYLIEIGEKGKSVKSPKVPLGHIYHIDNRGVAADPEDWFDEIHVKPYRYLQIAEAYHWLIRKIKEKDTEIPQVVKSADIFERPDVSKPTFLSMMKAFGQRTTRSTIYLIIIGLTAILAWNYVSDIHPVVTAIFGALGVFSVYRVLRMFTQSWHLSVAFSSGWLKFNRIFNTITLILALLICAWTAWNFYLDRSFKSLQAQYADPLTSQFMDIGGMPVHYRDEGSATDTIPVVLLHGTGSNLLTWNGWVESLKTTHRIVRLDLPAYGLTGPNAQHDYSASFYVQFLHRFLENKNINQCYLAGNSLGGKIAWEYALAYPGEVKKLILIDAAGFPQHHKSPLVFKIASWPILSSIFQKITPKSLIRKSLEDVYADDSRVTEDLVTQYHDMARREGNRAAFMSRGKMKMDSNYLKIKNIVAPTLILWGGKDKWILPENAHKFSQELPNDTLVIWPDLGHVPMEEDPKGTVAVVAKFLRK
jgi:pimeloyl-ACP methyl ester carboxylesterase